MCIQKKSILSSFFAVMVIGLLAGCSTLPDIKNPPADLNADNAVTIILKRPLPGKGLGDDSVIGFGYDYVIDIPGDWEEWSFFEGSVFNDNATFLIPAGEYEVQLHWNYFGFKTMTVETGAYDFEKGKKYAIYLLADLNGSTYSARISRIEEVE